MGANSTLTSVCSLYWCNNDSVEVQEKLLEWRADVRPEAYICISVKADGWTLQFLWKSLGYHADHARIMDWALTLLPCHRTPDSQKRIRPLLIKSHSKLVLYACTLMLNIKWQCYVNHTNKRESVILIKTHINSASLNSPSVSIIDVNVLYLILSICQSTVCVIKSSGSDRIHGLQTSARAFWEMKCSSGKWKLFIYLFLVLVFH